MKKLIPAATALLVLICFLALGQNNRSSSLSFEVTVAKGLISSPQNGRLFVVMSLKSQPEPRLTIGQTGLDASPVLGRDIRNFAPGVTGSIDETCAAFPIDGLARLPAGDYFVQALFDSNIDLKSVNAPGNLYSTPRKIHLDPAHGSTVRIELTEKLPSEQMPPDTDYVKYVKLQSNLLTRFHGRPIFLRAGVILPRGFDREPGQRYPLRVHIGGYGARFTTAQRIMREGSAFRTMWLSDSCPRMVFLHLDGDGPFGDCYQVNSDNNGPYGDAITQELIPYVEQNFRCLAQPWARVLDGGSTGGWVSLALQIFYPDFFNGTWSGFP
ncbi:MAG: alpha/beta hydrolase-fold protein, partial [Blastocatellia bacterium]